MTLYVCSLSDCMELSLLREGGAQITTALILTTRLTSLMNQRDGGAHGSEWRIGWNAF